MRVECPYCTAEVDVVRLERHVRMRDGGGHGPSGSIPMDGVDNPWNLRLDVPDPPEADADADVPEVAYDPEEMRRGRCPACDRGVLALAGGSGFLSRGRRRLVCPNCGWESPEWVNVEG